MSPNFEEVNACPKIARVSVGGLFADAVRSIAGKQSMSALWKSSKQKVKDKELLETPVKSASDSPNFCGVSGSVGINLSNMAAMGVE